MSARGRHAPDRSDQSNGERASPRRYRSRLPEREAHRMWFQLRCGPDDLKRIDAIARRLDCSRSEAVRRAILLLFAEDD